MDTGHYTKEDPSGNGPQAVSVRIHTTNLRYTFSSRQADHCSTMFLRFGALILVYQVAVGSSVPASYDQRQTGDFNVQIHLKDVQVVALLDTELLDDYTEYDYFYDYNDFTVKPTGKPTTSSPETSSESNISPTTEKSNVTDTVDSLAQNSTSPAPISDSTSENTIVEEANNSTQQETVNATEISTTLSIENSEVSSTTTINLKTRINDKTGDLFEVDDVVSTTMNTVQSSTEKPVRQLSRKRCRSGYSPDGKGRCRRLSQRRLSLIPLAMKIAPKLLDNMTRNAKNLVT